MPSMKSTMININDDDAGDDDDDDDNVVMYLMHVLQTLIVQVI